MHSTYLHKTVGKTCSPRRNADEWSPLFSSHVSLLMSIHISDSYESQPRNENKQTPPRATWHTERERERSSRLIYASQARSIDRLEKSHPPEKDLRARQLTLALEKRWSKPSVYRERGGVGEKSPPEGFAQEGMDTAPGELPPGACGWHRFRLLHLRKASAGLAHLSTSYRSLQRVELLKFSVDTALSAYFVCVCVLQILAQGFGTLGHNNSNI